jgi:hypothetical protein
MVVRGAKLGIVAALAVLAFAAPAKAADVGLVPDLTWGASAAEQEQTVAALTQVGAKWVRLSAQWKNVEPAVPGSYDQWWLAHIDRGVDLANAAGIKVVFMVYDAPVWASGSSGRNTPRNAQDFANFMSFIANRYRGKVEAYEVWNEQNIDRFWTSPSAAAYTTLLKAAYPAIKAADPTAEVVFGGVSTSDYPYIEAAYAAGAKGFFDVMAVHPYTYCGNTSPDTIRRAADGRMNRDSFLAYREVRASMAARGDLKPIWVTEFGWNTSTAVCDPGRGMWQGGVSEQAQADYLTRAFELFAADPYVEIALAYNLRNNYWQGNADTPEARYGAMTTAFAPKPAFYAIQAAALGATPPPPPPTTTPPPPPVSSDPKVALTSPADGSTWASDLPFRATASDDKGVVRVEFWVDGQKLKSDTGAPYAWTYGGWKKVARGPHTVEARAFDAAGNSGRHTITVIRP